MWLIFIIGAFLTKIKQILVKEVAFRIKEKKGLDFCEWSVYNKIYQ